MTKETKAKEVILPGPMRTAEEVLASPPKLKLEKTMTFAEEWAKKQQERLDKVSELFNCQVGKVFILTEDQIKLANELITKHEEEKHKGKPPYAGAAGGAYAWEFVNTGLGQCQGIKCMCGEYMSLTNFEDW